MKRYNTAIAIISTQAKSVRKLLRSKPFVVRRRAGILLLLQKRVEIGLLCIRRFERHSDAFYPRQWADLPAVIVRSRHGMHVAFNSERRRPFNFLKNSIVNGSVGGKRRGINKHKQTHQYSSLF